MLKQYLWIFLISMLPIVELRGAIPVGIGMGLPVWSTYLVCIVGNILPVPFLILFSKTLLNCLSTWPKIGPFFQRFMKKADEKAQNLGKYELLGLYLFVAIPLPGTGAWTGSVIAAILRMRLVKATMAIAAGVLTSGLIMLLVSQGFFGFLRFLF